MSLAMVLEVPRAEALGNFVQEPDLDSLPGVEPSRFLGIFVQEPGVESDGPRGP